MVKTNVYHAHQVNIHQMEVIVKYVNQEAIQILRVQLNANNVHAVMHQT